MAFVVPLVSGAGFAGGRRCLLSFSNVLLPDRHDDVSALSLWRSPPVALAPGPGSATASW